MFLFRSIRQSLAKQDEAQGVELSQLSTSAGALRQSVAEDRERETFTAAFHKYDADANGQIDEALGIIGINFYEVTLDDLKAAREKIAEVYEIKGHQTQL